jgi:hypothetical protein
MYLDLEGLVAQALLVAAAQLAAKHEHRCWLWLLATVSHDYLHHHYIGAVFSRPATQLPDEQLRWN